MYIKINISLRRYPLRIVYANVNRCPDWRILENTHHFILVVDAGALLEELLHDVQVPLGGGLLQRRVAALAAEISINVGDNGEAGVVVMGRVVMAGQ